MVKLKKWLIKDFKIKSYRTGNQLRTGAQLEYKIVWNDQEIKRGFARKSDALDFVKKLVRIQRECVDKLNKEIK